MIGQVADHAETALVEGTFLIHNSWANILFDPGATHSFISTSLAPILGLPSESKKIPLVIGSPMGGTQVIDRVCRSYVEEIAGHHLEFDLMIMDMSDYDVIVGMDWLESYRAIFDYSKKKVTISIPNGLTFTFYGNKSVSRSYPIFDTRSERRFGSWVASIVADEGNMSQIELMQLFKSLVMFSR